nr:OST-HTH/LOTUS domain-containing protein [Leucobacter exalbidus]
MGNGAGSATAAEAGTAGTAETAGAETSAPEKTGNSRSRSRRGSRASGAASRAAAGANGGSGSGSGANTGTDAAAAAGDAPSSSAQPAKADQGEGFADEINSALDALDTHDTHGDHDEHDLHDDGDAGDRVGDRTEDDEYEITGLLIRALWLGQEKDDSDWLHSSAVKQQMRRMDSSFNEKVLGFRSFSDFLKSRSDVAEVSGSGHERLVRLREQSDD